MDIGPKYRKIFDDLKKRIDDGELKPGDKIPSTVALCQEYGCSQTAVNTAVLLLMTQGYIVGSPGLGRFVTAD